MSELFREIMRQSQPKLERSPSTLSSASLRELRRRASLDSMAEEDIDGAQNLEYEVTLVSTYATFPRSMSEILTVNVSFMYPRHFYCSRYV